MKQNQRLFEVVEEERKTDFADLDADLVRVILDAQVRFQEDRVEARRRTGQAIARWAAEAAATSTESDG